MPFTTQATAVTLAATAPPPPEETALPDAARCSRRFRHWCLDNTSLDGANVTGIIVGGCIFIVLVVLAFVVFFRIRRSRRYAARGAACSLFEKVRLVCACTCACSCLCDCVCVQA